MTPLPEFMELNRNIILFLYGLVFFSLGTILALQSRSYSRLDLARSLKWLAAFGLIHGLYEWGDLFLPIQMPNLSEAAIRFWLSLHLVLLALSFACLLQFGLSLITTIPRLQLLPAALFFAWIIIVFGQMFFLPYELKSWRDTGDALARYFLAIPGAIVSAISLRRYALQRIAVLNVPHIIKLLRLAGFALFLYSIFGGLIVPPVSFFPGNILNNQAFIDLIGMPPLVFRSMIGLVLAITMIRALEIFDIEYARRIEAMEQQQILVGERERIARELHDGALQTVYTAGLLVESTLPLADPGGQVAERLERAVAALNHAIQDLRYSLNDLHSESHAEPVKSALVRMLEGEQFQSLIEVELSLDLPDSQTLSPIRMDHVLSIAREALTNVIRHAHAPRVSIAAHLQNHSMTVTIVDEGIGMDQPLSPGYGLRNMRDRARLLGGDIEIKSEVGKGTTVMLKFPVVEI